MSTETISADKPAAIDGLPAERRVLGAASAARGCVMSMLRLVVRAK